MVKSLYWESDRCAASQEMSLVLIELVCPLPCLKLALTRQFFAPDESRLRPLIIFQIIFNVILLYECMFPKWSQGFCMFTYSLSFSD